MINTSVYCISIFVYAFHVHAYPNRKAAWLFSVHAYPQHKERERERERVKESEREREKEKGRDVRLT